MKKLMFEDNWRISVLNSLIMKGKKLVEEIVFSCDVLDLDPINGFEEVKKLISDPNGFFIEKLPDPDNSKLFGIEINKSKIFDILDIDIKSVLYLINKADKTAIQAYIKVGILDENGFLQIDPVKLDNIFDQFRVYAVTDRELSFAEAYQNLIDAVQKLVEMGVNEKYFIKYPGKVWSTSNGHEIGQNKDFYLNLI